MEVNKLILGDNLEILKTIDSDTIYLIYLATPFFSNLNYEESGETKYSVFRTGGAAALGITLLGLTNV